MPRWRTHAADAPGARRSPSSPCSCPSLTSHSETSATSSPVSRRMTAAVTPSPSPADRHRAHLSRQRNAHLVERAHVVIQIADDLLVRLHDVQVLEIALCKGTQQQPLGLHRPVRRVHPAIIPEGCPDPARNRTRVIADDVGVTTNDATLSPIVELRQYTLHPGMRRTLIELFDRALIESAGSRSAST